jgi:hypothetical protein
VTRGASESPEVGDHVLLLTGREACTQNDVEELDRVPAEFTGKCDKNTTAAVSILAAFSSSNRRSAAGYSVPRGAHAGFGRTSFSLRRLSKEASHYGAELPLWIGDGLGSLPYSCRIWAPRRWP